MDRFFKYDYRIARYKVKYVKKINLLFRSKDLAQFSKAYGIACFTYITVKFIQHLGHLSILQELKSLVVDFVFVS